MPRCVSFMYDLCRMRSIKSGSMAVKGADSFGCAASREVLDDSAATADTATTPEARRATDDLGDRSVVIMDGIMLLFVCC